MPLKPFLVPVDTRMIQYTNELFKFKVIAQDITTYPPSYDKEVEMVIRGIIHPENRNKLKVTQKVQTDSLLLAISTKVWKAAKILTFKMRDKELKAFSREIQIKVQVKGTISIKEEKGLEASDSRLISEPNISGAEASNVDGERPSTSGLGHAMQQVRGQKRKIDTGSSKGYQQLKKVPRKNTGPPNLSAKVDTCEDDLEVAKDTMSKTMKNAEYKNTERYIVHSNVEKNHKNRSNGSSCIGSNTDFPNHVNMNNCNNVEPPLVRNTKSPKPTYKLRNLCDTSNSTRQRRYLYSSSKLSTLNSNVSCKEQNVLAYTRDRIVVRQDELAEEMKLQNCCSPSYESENSVGEKSKLENSQSLMSKAFDLFVSPMKMLLRK